MCSQYHDRHRQPAFTTTRRHGVRERNTHGGQRAARLPELGTKEGTASMGRSGLFPVSHSTNYAPTFPSGIRVSNSVNVKDAKTAKDLDDCLTPLVHVGFDDTNCQWTLCETARGYPARWTQSVIMPHYFCLSESRPLVQSC